MRYCPHLCRIILLVSVLVSALIYAPIQAKPAKERYPIIGTVSTVLSFNHSNFVEDDQSAAAQEYGLPQASGFGWVNSILSTNLSYIMPTASGYSPLYISGGVSFSRVIKESFARPFGANTVQPKQFMLNDLSLNLGWGLPGFNKITKGLSSNVGLGLSAPFSRMSRATGLVTSISPSFTLSYATPFRVVVQATAFGGYNILENPTIQVDCRLLPDYCGISGEDLGIPNQLMSYGGSFSAQVPLTGGFRLSLGYQLFGGTSAVTFPERENDPYASPYAQDENQYAGLFHGSVIAVIFGFNRAGSAAQQALNESLEGKKKKKKAAEPSFLSRLNLIFAMRTTQRFYSSDNTRVTVPIFDFETDNYSRTNYSFVIRFAL